MSLTLSQVKSHLRIEHYDEDDYITSLIATGYQIAENYTSTTIIQAEKIDYLDDFDYAITMANNPVISITSIAYNDADSITQSQTDFYLDNRDTIAVLKPLQNQAWPTTDQDHENVVITYQAGYTTIPAAIDSAVLLIVGSLYEQRENHIAGALSRVPMSAEYLLTPYRVVHV